MLIQICVGSSCHLKGTEQIISLFQQALKEYALEEEVTLAGASAPAAATARALPSLWTTPFTLA